MIYDVEKDSFSTGHLKNGKDAIKWCVNDEWWIVEDESQGIRFNHIPIHIGDNLLQDKEEGVILIKAIQKAVEIGWLK